MYAVSVHSTAGTISSLAKKMMHHGHPDLAIILHNHSEGKIYSTFDALSGNVSITAPYNARFDEIQITLEGTTRTHVENLSPQCTRSKTTASHNFLRLTMPIKESDYPQPRIAEAGRTYTFPFNFVIPDQLLPRACSHVCTADHVHEAHLQLPPSMRDKLLSLKDDLAPDMSRVRYAVTVKVIRHAEEDERHVTLVEGSKNIHVVPAQAEAPPMSIEPENDQYVLSKTKSLRKGILKGKLGKITVSAQQTGALMLPPPAESSTTPGTTMATIRLRFDPHDTSSKPPRLGGLTTKIRVSTFFAVRPTRDLPTKNGSHIEFDTARGVYETSVPINSRCVEGVSWTKQSAHLRRKNSASSTSSSDCSDSNLTIDISEARGDYYTATILVPITLPSSKSWLPSFHTCTVSRVYQLDLSLSVQNLGKGVPTTSIGLHLPVQIGACGSGSRRATLTAAEAAAELADADEFLRPRVIEIPSAELVGNSILAGPVEASELPPSYEDFALLARLVVDPGRG